MSDNGDSSPSGNMYPGLNVADFVNALLGNLQAMGYNNERKILADQVGVDVTTVAKWIRGDTSRLQEKSLMALVDFAALNGVYIEEYSKGPVLWPANLPYEDMLKAEHDDVFPPARLDHVVGVSVFGRVLQSPFGVVAGPSTAHWDWCRRLLESGIGFIELKTTVADAREPKDEPTLFSFLRENPQLPGDAMRAASFRPRRRDDNLCLGLGTNLGLPCPAPEVWVDGIRDLLRHANEWQIVLPSVTGSPWKLTSEKEFVLSLVKAAELAVIDAESPFLVVNISCPTLADYFASAERTLEAIQAVRKCIGDASLLVKIGAWPEPILTRVLCSIGPLIDGVIAINGVPFRANTVTQGAPEDRGILGVSGVPIKSAAIRTVTHLVKLRAENAELKNVALIAAGGVTRASDVDSFLGKGADLVGAQTAILQDPHFIWKVHAHLAVKEQKTQDHQERSDEVLSKEFGKALLLFHRKYPESTLPDNVILGTFRTLLRSSNLVGAPRRSRGFRYARDILGMLEQNWRFNK